MIFTKEMLEHSNIANLPTTNELDCSYMCEGKLNKNFYRCLVDHFSRVELPIYAVYVPLTRIADHNEWNPIKLQGCSCCGNDLRLEALTASEQQEIWIENEKYDCWMPRIVPCEDFEGWECGKIWCHALGVKNVNEYKNKPILSFNEAKELFPDGLNWVHIKIG
jgi:hypothetical protein